MKTRAAFVLLLCFAGAALAQAGAAPAQPPPAPRIVCDESAYNFGTIESTGTVTHAYEIRNAGNAPLNVTRVHGSCGCTTATISTNVLQAGGKASITAVFRPGGRSGQQDKYVAVYSDDPTNTMFVLRLRGLVKRDVLISPENLMPGRIRPDQPFETKILFENIIAEPLHITSTSCDLTNLVTSVVEMQPGKKYAVVVKTLPPLENGTMQGTIHIFTDNTNRPVFDVPFSAAVVGPLVAAPPQLFLEASDGPISRFILISPGSTQTFKVLGVETPDPAITTQQMKFGLAGVRIMINNIVAKPQLDGKVITITTDVAEMKEIRIPIHVAPARKP